MKLSHIFLFTLMVHCNGNNVAGKKKKAPSVSKETPKGHGRAHVKNCNQKRQCKWDASDFSIEETQELDIALRENGPIIKCTRKNVSGKGKRWSGVCNSGEGSAANFVLVNVSGIGEKIFGSVVDPSSSSICTISIDQDGDNEVSCNPFSSFKDEEDAEILDEVVDGYHTLYNDRRLRGGVRQHLPSYMRNQQRERSLQYNDLGGTIDILVVWTKKAECKRSNLADACTITAITTANMRGLVQLAVAETNQAFVNSGVNTQLRLVHAYLDDTYVEPATSTFSTALYDLQGLTDGKLDSAHINRQKYGADLVHMIIGGTASCGIGFLPSSTTSLKSSQTFSVSSYACAAGYYSFGHEIAHNLGALHDRGTENKCNTTTYNYGYRDPYSKFRSIMGYECNKACDIITVASCPRVQMFSSSTSLYNQSGTPMLIGNAFADNARVLNNRKSQAASLFPAMNCQSHNDCNDGNSCTEDLCVENGVCVWNRNMTLCTPQCSSNGDIQFSVEILTDNYGSETTWSIRNTCNGSVVDSGGPYANNRRSTYTTHYCLPPGQYNFTISDSNGDGICCSRGAGQYSLYQFGNLIKQSSSFRRSESHIFGSPCPAPSVVTSNALATTSPTKASTVQWCSSGWTSTNTSVCCAYSCGKCGGTGCGSLTGGGSNCCTGAITTAGRYCVNATDTVCIIPNATV